MYIEKNLEKIEAEKRRYFVRGDTIQKSTPREGTRLRKKNKTRAGQPSQPAPTGQTTPNTEPHFLTQRHPIEATETYRTTPVRQNTEREGPANPTTTTFLSLSHTHTHPQAPYTPISTSSLLPGSTTTHPHAS